MASQCRLCLGFAPRFVCDPTKRETRLLDPATLKLESGRNRDQRKRVGQPVADFQIAVIGGKALRGKLDSRDDFARLEIVIVLRCVARQPVKIIKGDCTLSRGTSHMYCS